jgi:uncharacterized membrane protein (Fun14 family)
MKRRETKVKRRTIFQKKIAAHFGVFGVELKPLDKKFEVICSSNIICKSEIICLIPKGKPYTVGFMSTFLKIMRL